MTAEQFQADFAERIVGIAEVAGRAMAPADVVGALLSAAVAVGLRHAPGSAVAEQIRALAEHVAELPQHSPVDPGTLN